MCRLRGEARACSLTHLVGRRHTRQRRLEELGFLLFDDGAERLAQGAEGFVVQAVQAAQGGGGGRGLIVSHAEYARAQHKHA